MHLKGLNLERSSSLCVTRRLTNRPTKTAHVQWIPPLCEISSCSFLRTPFYLFLCAGLISHSLCDPSQRLRSNWPKLLCVSGMNSALKQAAVPCRSPRLGWCHQRYTSSFCFVPPAHSSHQQPRQRLGVSRDDGHGSDGRAGGSQEVCEWGMSRDKGKWPELSYCLLGLQATSICDTQIGYCNVTPAALVAHTPPTGDRVKYLQQKLRQGASSLLRACSTTCAPDDQISEKDKRPLVWEDFIEGKKKTCIHTR